ncbi:hypothetical protein SD72_02685 [Leucobacter komagatae]|uniref:Uncharacterized protein n=1 Tax=Leucobacter komagatae TaxID=55969 RepID=A0A0D0IRI9_9MICO|nr:hypothetical protein [Leucobacter komagatae]KIP53582.1 hypothetical protein SD72_02685 [Leucobacter komagatae]
MVNREGRSLGPRRALVSAPRESVGVERDASRHGRPLVVAQRSERVGDLRGAVRVDRSDRAHSAPRERERLVAPIRGGRDDADFACISDLAEHPADGRAVEQ